MIKQGLELKQTQKLSPLQLQTIKLIEVPVQELRQRVKTMLEENPVLDDDHPMDSASGGDDDQPKDISIDEIDTDAEDPTPSYNLWVNNHGKDPIPEYNTFSVKESFSQTLEEQLGFRNLSSRRYDIGRFIIGSLDDSGYLRRDVASLVDDIAFRTGIETDEEEVVDILKIIQTFDPAGIGARDLRECLLLQLDRMAPEPDVLNAKTILGGYFDDFANKHFTRIMNRAGLSEEEMKSAVARIIRLNPSPGGQIEDSYKEQAQQIIPDFVLDLEDGQLKLTMPRFNIPELKIKKKYSDLLADSKGSTDPSRREAAAFVKQKIDSAKWFVEALKQRFNTLETTMNAIIDYQRDYFIDGDESNLKPMVLKDIAEITGYDISTISRVVNSKYIETHFGIYPLKYFFSEGLENAEGDEVSTRELKKYITELVEAEDKRRPLTDDQLVEKMSEKGYKVARRTVAKYRDQLGIPKARLRKEL